MKKEVGVVVVVVAVVVSATVAIIKNHIKSIPVPLRLRFRCV